MVRSVLAAGVAAALLVPAAADARPKAKPKRPAPWATVNVCDTRAHPDAIGVRGWMPPLGRKRERHYMRFFVQWRDPASGDWQNVGDGGDSGWISLGRGRHRAHEKGMIFRYEAPPAGQPQTLRGVVRFQWRARGKRLRLRTAVTEKGHRSAAGSDPKGYTAAICELTTPAEEPAPPQVPAPPGEPPPGESAPPPSDGAGAGARGEAGTGTQPG